VESVRDSVPQSLGLTTGSVGTGSQRLWRCCRSPCSPCRSINIVVVALPEIGRELGYSAQMLRLSSVLTPWRPAASCYSAVAPQISPDDDGGSSCQALLFMAVLPSREDLRRRQSFCLAPARCRELVVRSSFPATLSLVSTLFAEGRERNRALAVWGGAGAAAVIGAAAS
jgi:hypothetical protein